LVRLRVAGSALDRLSLYLLNKHAQERVVVCTSAKSATELASLAPTSERIVWCVTSANREAVSQQAVASVAAAPNAALLATESMSTGVDLPHVKIGISSRLHSAEDLAQRAGRVARAAGETGTVYILYSKDDYTTCNDDGVLEGILTTEGRLGHALASAFLSPADTTVPTCADREPGLRCSNCDKERTESLIDELKSQVDNFHGELDDVPVDEADTTAAWQRRRQAHDKECEAAVATLLAYMASQADANPALSVEAEADEDIHGLSLLGL
jgi:superfamily II DNA/RNA helicase